MAKKLSATFRHCIAKRYFNSYDHDCMHIFGAFLYIQVCVQQKKRPADKHVDFVDRWLCVFVRVR